MIFEPHSTRLFPKSGGAKNYVVTGLAHRCDWVLLTDNQPPYVYLHRNRSTDNPKHIFLSLRSPFKAIEYFCESILPTLQAEFVLVSGSEDATLPRQIDARWRSINERETAMIDRILNHPCLKHWYVENLDQVGHHKLSPLPLGLVFPNGCPDGGIIVPQVPT